jgi:hypothetical protein
VLFMGGFLLGIAGGFSLRWILKPAPAEG